MPKVYQLVRDHDVSGISGTGVVAHAVEFPNGKVAMCWCSNSNPASVTVYDSMADAEYVHCHGGSSHFERLFR